MAQSDKYHGLGWLKIPKIVKMKKIPPRCCFCGATEWENINKKSRKCLSTLLKAYQIYKGNSTQIQRKTEDEGKIPF